MHARKPRERLLGPALRTQSDRRLVRLARDGSEAAQEEIVRRYRAALVRYAGSIVGAAAAEDVVQDSLAKGLAALGRAGEELRLRPWLYAIVRNTALNHLRDAGPATEQLDESYDGVEQPPAALERRERVRSLVGGLRRLPSQQRQALVKRELEGRSHEEIGAELGVSSGAARQLIFRARESLRVGFGSLLPMPLLRWLAESGGDGAAGVAAGAGGGAAAVKAAVAVFAAGAAVTAGVAVDHGERGRTVERPAAEGKVRPAVAADGGDGVEANLEAVATAPGSGRRESATEEGSGRGRGGSAGHGPGDSGRGQNDGGPGPSESAGPGSGAGGDRGGDVAVRGDDSRGGRGRSDGGGSGSSHRGDGGSGGGSDGGGHGGGSQDGSGHGGSSGSGESRSGSGHDDSGHSGDGKRDGGTGRGGSGDGGHDGSSDTSGGSGADDAAFAPSSTSGPSSSSSSDPGSGAAAPESGGGSSTGSGSDGAQAGSGSSDGSGSSGSDGGSGSSSGSGSASTTEIPRDLSGRAVSQGSDDPE
jgi:RNA polymerase sigma factor (sigma-70 family)